ALSGVAAITGWAIDNTVAANLGPIYEMDAYLDGVLIASTNPQISSNLISRVPRTGGQYNPCTQYPGRSDCSAPGFTFNWNTSPYAGTSQHTLLIDAEGGGQTWSYTSMSVTVSN
ncbi:MAG TPA: hypothetical protein VHD76_01385, partial [Bryobacteraceae bacterium]|nr:hypothetical protein [Bryobacteraceae bacterium]